MADSSDVPEIITIDQDGKLNIEASTNKQPYDLVIVVSTKRGDSTMIDTKRVEGVKIKIECGPDSTTITVPPLKVLLQDENSGDPMSYGNEFSSSNVLCPLQTVELTKGTEYYDFTPDVSKFELSLKSDFLEKAAVYEYTVTAITEGNGKLPVTSSFNIVAQEGEFKSDTGTTLKTHGFGDINTPISNNLEPKDNIYISGIRACTENQVTETISGL